MVFENAGIDYAGPMYIKSGHIREPTLLYTYIYVFATLTVKAVHLELVSDLTMDTFILMLRQFVACSLVESLRYCGVIMAPIMSELSKSSRNLSSFWKTKK